MGVALDGLGYGLDGTLWGGEFLHCDYTDFERLGTFKPVALLGGTQAMREPWRNTFAHIMAEMGWERYKIEYDDLELTRFFEAQPLEAYKSMLKSGFNSPKASSCGRLFDAVAGALGICRETASYEGQAAIELEAIVDETQLNDESLAYPFGIPRLAGSRLPYVEPIAVWHALLGDLIEGTPPATMAARFHLGLAKVIVAMVQKLQFRDDVQIFDAVALSGGVFQNRILLELVSKRLESLGFRVMRHRQVPANDGGISLGQAVISAAMHIKGRGN
jgi:hydrogenase maturation protein HypF